jgi:DNA-binding response OmpR family regulator
VLVVDDEPMVREVVGRYLSVNGYVVCEAADGPAAVTALTDFKPDLVVLDVMLPTASGFDILREIRSHGELPVILLTARVEESDRVLGLELGADDYVLKPFSPRELVARVRSVLRRSRSTSRPGGDATLRFDSLTIDPVSREVTVDDITVELTPKEFDLLLFLASSPRQVFSRAQLLEHVWDSSPQYQDPATVTVHVRRLRGKIEHDPDNPQVIATVWGVGYRFEP